MRTTRRKQLHQDLSKTKRKTHGDEVEGMEGKTVEEIESNDFLVSRQRSYVDQSY